MVLSSEIWVRASLVIEYRQRPAQASVGYGSVFRWYRPYRLSTFQVKHRTPVSSSGNFEALDMPYDDLSLPFTQFLKRLLRTNFMGIQWEVRQPRRRLAQKPTAMDKVWLFHNETCVGFYCIILETQPNFAAWKFHHFLDHTRNQGLISQIRDFRLLGFEAIPLTFDPQTILTTRLSIQHS